MLTRAGPPSSTETAGSSVRRAAAAAAAEAEPGERGNTIILARITNWKCSIGYLMILK